jgi:putative acetyltransferase
MDTTKLNFSNSKDGALSGCAIRSGLSKPAMEIPLHCIAASRPTTMPTRPTIIPARFPDDTATVRSLFAEYVDSLGIDLSFQNVAAELAELPGKYAPPAGALLIARDAQGQALGCVALRPLDQSGACEMKRLYVRPAARGLDLGRRLAEEIIAAARAAGHTHILLDTLAQMRAAQALYSSLGFRTIAAYYDNPLTGTVYMRLDL